MMKSLVAGVLLAWVAVVHAAQIPLTPGSVIGSSGSLGAGFEASKIFDEQLGTVTDRIRGSYWLNGNNTGNVPVYITVDLGASYSIGSFEIFNTHNDIYYDRGTGAFSILASNSVVDAGSGNFRLSGASVTLVSGSLSAVTTVTPPAQTFASLSSAGYRYLSFVPLGTASLNPIAGPTAYGLNELRVFATPVPEPGALLLLATGLPVAIGLARRRRQLLAGR